MNHKLYSALLLWFLLVLQSVLSSTLAKGFDDQDFSLRFDAALSRFANYGDVVGLGGASVGSTFSSSINPASTVWRSFYPSGNRPPKTNPDGDIDYRSHQSGHWKSASLQYTDINFDNGGSLLVRVLGWTYDTQNHSNPTSFEIGIANASTTTSRWRTPPIGSTLERPNFNLDADILTMGVSRRLDETLTVGGDVGYQSSESITNHESVLYADSDSDSWNVNFGILKMLKETKNFDTRNVKPNQLFGLMVTFGKGNTDLDGINNSKIQSEQRQIRLGISQRWQEGTYSYFDYQLGRFENKDEHLTIQRIYLGHQLQFNQRLYGFRAPLYTRFGVVYDAEDNTSYALGFGLASEKIHLDIGFQRDMFVELDRELGGSNLCNFSLSFKW